MSNRLPRYNDVRDEQNTNLFNSGELEHRPENYHHHERIERKVRDNMSVYGFCLSPIVLAFFSSSNENNEVLYIGSHKNKTIMLKRKKTL